jgi:hypothetical protein
MGGPDADEGTDTLVLWYTIILLRIKNIYKIIGFWEPPIAKLCLWHVFEKNILLYFSQNSLQDFSTS